jgi:hypothetical protein
MKVKPIVAWYDLWVGLFIDRPKRRLYFFPVPCFGLIFEWRRIAMGRFVPRYSDSRGDWYVFDTISRDLLNWATSEADAKRRCAKLNGEPLGQLQIGEDAP